jgi:integrase
MTPHWGGVRGLLLKHSYGGTLTFYLAWYPKGGGTRQHKLGRYPAMKLATARTEALTLQEDLRKDPDHLVKKKQAQDDVQTFAVVAANFKRLYIEKHKLRTARVIWQQIETHLIPTLGPKDFNTISRKRDLTPLFDKIEAENGPSMADAVLTVLQSICNFQTLRDEDYRSPLVRGMKRYKNNPRKRALETDEEIRAFWTATESLGTYGALARVCLLLGQRRAKVNLMKWTDIKDGVWTLGHAAREKPNCGAIKLPPFVLAIIEAQPRLAKNPFVFAALQGRGAFNAFGQYSRLMTKREQETLPDMKPHTVHDLRRTFRSICPKLGIDRETAERCLGHLIGNAIERTYDQYAYLDEMGVAFATFARHIQAVVIPRPANVVSLRGERAQGRRARTPA